MKAQKTHHREITLRLNMVKGFCFLFALSILIRAAYLQIIPNPKLANLEKRQFYSKLLLKPRRGNILDRNLEPLAISVETSSLAVNPSKVRNKASLATKLSAATGVAIGVIRRKLQEPKEFAWIKRHLNKDELERLRKFHLTDGDGDWVSGLWIVKESQRAYPHSGLAMPVLGSVNIDSDGNEGVELQFDKKLRGKIVSVDAIKDGLGRPTFIDASAAKQNGAASDGKNIVLTLDASLQYAAEQALEAAVRRTLSLNGQVLIMDAQSGEILVMAQSGYPTHLDGPNSDSSTSSGPSLQVGSPKRNRLITDGFEPGSIFKPILLAAALQKGLKLTETVWGGRGHFEIQGHAISEAEAHEKYEWINLQKMIQISSNVGAAKLALKLGADPFLQLLHHMGFGSKSGIEFPGETSGKIPKLNSKLQPLSLATLGFGQGALVNSIQMVRAYATFINGGWLVQPSIVVAEGRQTKAAPPKRILSQNIAEQVLKALKSVTEEGGTGVKANLNGYRVAGKTGTAQVVDPSTGHYSKSHYFSSFIGFPLELPKKLVIFTALNRPQGVYYASDTAAPLFSEILSVTAHRFSFPTNGLNGSQGVTLSKTRQDPSLGKNLAPFKGEIRPFSDASQWGSSDSIKLSAAARSVLNLNPENSSLTSSLILPDYKGLSAREVLRSLHGTSIHVEMAGFGTVMRQIPEAGKMISRNGKIKLILTEY